MKNNLFKMAIESNSAPAFFRGQSQYFVPSPDYEGHVHGAQMGGAARVYAEESSYHSKEFDEAFLIFLDSLDVSREDLNHLLANLSSYFAQKSRGGFPDSHLFETHDNPEWNILNEFIQKVFDSSFFEDVEAQIKRHAIFIDKKGYNFLLDIVLKLK
jgi:hypothetical protein